MLPGFIGENALNSIVGLLDISKQRCTEQRIINFNVATSSIRDPHRPFRSLLIKQYGMKPCLNGWFVKPPHVLTERR
ncbi:hypothetical protein Sbs19_08790 [Sphingobium sp. BS19]|nr:hypothetical protein Sbs19_08790 [Sphingobium sp. BS19]